MTNIVTTESGEKFTLFFTIRSPFSNFHPCRFTICEDIGNGKPEERLYYSTEQYYMYHKALSAGDSGTAEQIAGERDARKIKMMSRNIRNFERETWNKVSGDVMRRGNFAKYTQNPLLRKKLFYTYGSTLVECSPTDVEWGIGLDINEPDALSPSKWRGKNKLGQILTEIREELWLKPEYAHEVNDILSMLENFESFSRQFFLPPKPSVQQSSRSSLGENDGDFDKRRSLPCPMETGRTNDGNHDKHHSFSERAENISDSGPRDPSSSRIENASSAPHRQRYSRSRRSIRKRSYRHLPCYDRDHSRRRSSSDDSRGRERNDSRTKKRKEANSNRSRHNTKSRHDKYRSSSDSDRDSSGISKRQRRIIDGLDVDSNNEWRRVSSEKFHRSNTRQDHDISSSGDEESSSSIDEITVEELKKTRADPFKSLLERLRSKQCGMWEQCAGKRNGDDETALPIHD